MNATRTSESEEGRIFFFVLQMAGMEQSLGSALDFFGTNGILGVSTAYVSAHSLISALLNPFVHKQVL